MTIEPALFRRVMGRFATGITVVTVRDGDRLHGITVSAFCSVSLDPPLSLICIDRTAHAHDLIARAGAWAINVLGEGQRALSEHFAQRWDGSVNPFAEIEYHPGPATGAPLIDGCIAWAECRLASALDGGDHTIYLGRVVAGRVTSAEPPLLYFASRYGRLEDGAHARDHLRPW